MGADKCVNTKNDGNASGTFGKMERAMGFEPTTSCLGSKHSTTELHPLVVAETSPNILQTAWNSKARHATLRTIAKFIPRRSW